MQRSCILLLLGSPGAASSRLRRHESNWTLYRCVRKTSSPATELIRYIYSLRSTETCPRRVPHFFLTYFNPYFTPSLVQGRDFTHFNAFFTFETFRRNRSTSSRAENLVGPHVKLSQIPRHGCESNRFSRDFHIPGLRNWRALRRFGLHACKD